MNRIILTILLFSTPILAGAADDVLVSQLERDVRNLQREVSSLSQQIDELRRQLSRSGDRVPVPSASTPGPANTLWLDATRWKQVKAGMSELEVINLLGPPASMRAANQERVLLYALEISSSGFLGGSVTLRDRVVVEVKAPVLQ
jgi:outer membrane murein-binding lipoprotein Lpp